MDSRTLRVYAADAAAGRISVLDGRSGAVLTTLPIGRTPVALAVNPTTGHLFVADADAGAVTVVDMRRNAVVATAPVGATPTAVAVDPRTGLVYVATNGEATQATLASGRTVTVLRDGDRPPALLAAVVADVLARRAPHGAGSG